MGLNSLFFYYNIYYNYVVNKTKKAKINGIHPFNNKHRMELGFHSRVKYLRDYKDKFYSMFRMMPEEFDFIHNRIRSRLAKTAHNALPSDFRLEVTLR